jgi:branched-chain amino acid transport system substrate-binding protein
MNILKTSLLAGAAALVMFAGAAHAQIKIATVGPMTGDYASFGEQMKAGAEQAVKDINAAGGVLGQQLELTVGDDACDPKQAVAVANQLVAAGVQFVAGHFCSGSSIPAGQVYTEEGVLQMTPASTNPKLTDEGGDNIFRVCGRDDQQGKFAGGYVAEHFGNKKIAILHDRSAYGKGLADETKKALNELGVPEALYEPYTPGESDYSALVTKLNAEKIEVVYIGGYHKEAGLITRQLREQGSTAQLISGDALNSAEFWSITGDAGEGFMFTFGPDPRLLPSAASVVDEFKKANVDPEGYTLYTYAAIEVFKAAAEQTGSLDLKKMIETLRANEYKTVLGPRSFDAKGDIKQSDYVMYAWSKGNYKQIP